ncbi:MAG: hypothetical protein ACJAR0_004355 [Candidatus Azotimanducaceae bacterium]|jgi:hypothetical protein
MSGFKFMLGSFLINILSKVIRESILKSSPPMLHPFMLTVVIEETRPIVKNNIAGQSTFVL